MADITFRSMSSGDTIAAAVDPGKPSGTASTDILVACFAQGNNGGGMTLSAPSGWTAIFSQQDVNGQNGTQSMRTWWALGNVASTNFTSNTNTYTGIVILAFQNVNNTTPIDATGTANSNTGLASLTVNAVTTVTDRALEVIGFSDWNNATFSASGFTNEENAGQNVATTCLYKNSVTTPAGSTGTVSVSGVAGSNEILIAQPFALRPAASGASETYPAGYFDTLQPAIYRM